MCHGAPQYSRFKRQWVGRRQTDTDSPELQVQEPARVYPAPDAPGRWIVEAPATAAAAPMLFSGPNAQKLALRYAYEAFGRARFFPF
jgi:hypothetical protein